MKSDVIKKGIERAPHRSLLYALGCTDADFSKPFIGIANSFSEIVPGHMHLRSISAAVREGIRAAGGVPFEFNTIAVCDGIAMNHLGMKYSLASRELIADSVEVMALAHAFDGLVMIPNCDKVVPGMLMAAVRLNMPSVFVSGGPMLAGKMVEKGDKPVRDIDLNTVFLAVGKVLTGEITEAKLAELEKKACPGCGSCAGMFTANTMNCLTEALGMALPGNGTIPAATAERLALARDAGSQVVRILDKHLCPRDIINKDSLYNAFAVDMALGGSTNSILHLTAIAHEAGVDFPLSAVNELSQKTPNLCRISPASDVYHIEDLNRAGGIQAVMKELGPRLRTGALTVSGATVAEQTSKAAVADAAVIHPISNPYTRTGGLAVLFGNLAPEGAVVKAAAVAPEMLVHKGPAHVFDSEEEVSAAIMKKAIRKGEVVVVRYEGPKGGPGMREMLTPTSLLSGMGMDKEVALITDGRFSGASRGAAIGHISPEAASGGPIAALKDGDVISINIPEGKLDVELSADEIKKRISRLPAFEPRIKQGYLKRYARNVLSASRGAVVE